MNTISMELHEEQITELQYQIEKLENEKHYLEEELEDLKVENEDLQDRYKSYKETSQTILNIHNNDLEKIKKLHEFNNELSKQCKAYNRYFFILALVYAITLMINLFIL